jgi:hypothetical protein
MPIPFDRRRTGGRAAQARPQAPRADEVLAAVAARYPVGATITLSMVAEAYGVSEGTASQVRRWARSVGRWAYVDGKRGAPPSRVRPIGPPRLTGADWS